MLRHLRKPDFNRLRKTLLRGQADAIPLIELGIHPRIKSDIMGHPVITIQDDMEFMASMGYDFVKAQPAISFSLDKIKAVENLTDNDDRAWAPEHGGGISSLADFEKYPWPSISDISYARLEQLKDGRPDGMGVIGQYGDIFTLAWELMGFEKFAIAVYEEPELIKALMDKIGSLNYAMFESMSQMDWVGALWYSDDIAYSTGLLMSPAFYREYLFPWVKKIGDLAKSRDIPFLYHSDGILYPVIEDLIQCGVTALHPIEPKAMEIREVKERYRDRLAVCGNIEVDRLSQGTVAEIEEQVKLRIREAGPGGAYCLGSSNSIPDYVKTENYIAMVQTALECGTY